MRDTRLHCAVIRGEIDNTRTGSVTVKFWLVGRSSPVTIQLSGDCLADLAGRHVTFESTPIEPYAALEEELGYELSGQAGEITASERVYLQKPSTLGGFDAPALVNVLRVECFTPTQRILFESYNFTSNLLEIRWNMGTDALFAQKASNFAQWQEHLAKWNPFLTGASEQDLANVYDEINQRLSSHLEWDQLEAALMGWDGILSALADDLDPDEEDASSFSLASEEELDLFDETYSIVSWNHTGDPHPLIESTSELIEDLELIAQSGLLPAGYLYQTLLSLIEEIAEGLRGLLNPTIVGVLSEETSLIGCREFLGKMMTAFYQLSSLLNLTEAPEGRKELLYVREAMLELREGISALRFEIKKL